MKIMIALEASFWVSIQDNLEGKEIVPVLLTPEILEGIKRQKELSSQKNMWVRFISFLFSKKERPVNKEVKGFLIKQVDSFPEHAAKDMSVEIPVDEEMVKKFCDPSFFRYGRVSGEFFSVRFNTRIVTLQRTYGEYVFLHQSHFDVYSKAGYKLVKDLTDALV